MRQAGSLLQAVVKEKRPKPSVEQRLLLDLISRLLKGAEMYLFFNIVLRKCLFAYKLQIEN